jgi:hypothetical protein
VGKGRDSNQVKKGKFLKQGLFSYNFLSYNFSKLFSDKLLSLLREFHHGTDDGGLT